MSPRRKTITQKVFVDAAEQAAKDGKTPDQALAEASKVAYDRGPEDSRLPAVVKHDLGLEDDELRMSFGRRIAKRYIEADEERFPSYIEDVTDPAVKAKIKIEYTKMHLNQLADAFIVKTERRINSDSDYAMKTDEELEYFKLHGRWPQTINGSSSVN